MASATARALGTVEILENILLHLPARDLLLATRISSTWAAVISTSVHIQRQLFLVPIARSLQIANTPPYDEVDVNPMIEAAFSNHLDHHSRPTRWVTAQGEHVIVFLVRIISESWPDSFKYPEASWRNMLLTQPPVTEASVQNIATYFSKRGVAHFVAKNAEGVRMREVIFPR